MKRKIPKKTTKKTTEKKLAFAKEFMVDFNQSKAAERVGTPKKTSRQVGYCWMGDSIVTKEVERLKVLQMKRINYHSDRVILELARIAFADIRELYNEDGSLKNPKKIEDAAASTLAAVQAELHLGDDGDVIETKKIKTWDKLRALELLGKHYKMFIDRVEVNVNNLAVELNAAQERKNVALQEAKSKTKKK